MRRSDTIGHMTTATRIAPPRITANGHERDFLGRTIAGMIRSRDRSLSSLIGTLRPEDVDMPVRLPAHDLRPGDVLLIDGRELPIVDVERICTGGVLVTLEAAARWEVPRDFTVELARFAPAQARVGAIVFGAHRDGAGDPVEIEALVRRAARDEEREPIERAWLRLEAERLAGNVL